MAPNPFVDPITGYPVAGGFRVSPPKPKPAPQQTPGPYGPRGPRTAIKAPTPKPVLTPQDYERIAYKQALKEAADAKPPKQAVSPADQTKAMQQFLKNRGYNIAVDGVRGPQTNAAVLAFHQHVAPQQYNAKNAPPVVKGPGAHGNGADTTAPPAKVVTKRAPAATKTTPTTGDPALDALINPATYAAGATNAAYDPQIAELQRQISLGGKQATGNQSDIAAWYRQLDNLAKSTHGANVKAADAAQTGYDDSAAAIGSLFGGQNSDPAFHDIQSGLLRANAQTDSAFDEHMRTILQGAGASAATNQKVRDSNSASELASKLLDLRGAKGQAYQSAYQQGLQNRTQQEAAQQASQLAQQLAPSQVAQAKAAAQVATTNAASAKQMADANLKLVNAQVKKAQAAASSTNGGQGWNLSHPNDRGQLTAALRTGLQTKLGGFRIDPISASSNIQQSLIQAGLQNDPQAKAIADSLIQETLNNAHSKHLWGGFKWDGTKVVRSNKHFDKKTGKLVPGQNG